jgi:deazaflavin-dependent oxidoreductase (nitroreductase family)
MTDPSRSVRWWQRPAMPLASSRLGGWFAVRVAPGIDRLLMRLSRGRLSITVGFPTLILTTTGAKTGLPRATPLIFLPQGEQILIVASNGGGARHPGWYHNLVANPLVSVFAYGATRQYRARVLDGAEREAAWRAMAALYPGYVAYQERTGGRTIPVVVLTPAS